MTSASWPQIMLDALLKPVARKVSIDPTVEYPLLGARWYAKGLFQKEVKIGSEIKATHLFEVRSGDFVYNRLFAWKGSFAVASPENDGCFVSNEFPCFEVDRTKILPEFLWIFFQREATWNAVLGLSFGATPTSRNRLKEANLLTMSIPLPTLDEQKRIVERIEFIASRMTLVGQLRAQVNDASDEICRSIIRNSSSTPQKMVELVTLREPDVKVSPNESYHFAGVYCFGKGVFVGQQKTGMEFQYTRLTRLRTGDFVYPKLMAWEGALASVPPECNGLVVSTEFPVFAVNFDKVLPEVLDIHFRTPHVWPKLSGASTGTNVRRRRLNPSDFLRYEFPLPPMEVQLQLRRVRSKLEAIQLERRSSEREFSAILPSVLDRAFRGEL